MWMNVGIDLTVLAGDPNLLGLKLWHYVVM